MVEQISHLVTQIRTTLLEVGLKPSTIAFKKERIEEATDQQREVAIQWLQNFQAKELKAYQEAMDLVPALTRNMYRLSGLPKSTHEEVELERTKGAIITGWRDRPSILRRSDNAKTKSRTHGGKTKGKNKKPRGSPASG